MKLLGCLALGLWGAAAYCPSPIRQGDVVIAGDPIVTSSVMAITKGTDTYFPLAITLPDLVQSSGRLLTGGSPSPAGSVQMGDGVAYFAFEGPSPATSVCLSVRFANTDVEVSTSTINLDMVLPYIEAAGDAMFFLRLVAIRGTALYNGNARPVTLTPYSGSRVGVHAVSTARDSGAVSAVAIYVPASASLYPRLAENVMKQKVYNAAAAADIGVKMVGSFTVEAVPASTDSSFASSSANAVSAAGEGAASGAAGGSHVGGIAGGVDGDAEDVMVDVLGVMQRGMPEGGGVYTSHPTVSVTVAGRDGFGAGNADSKYVDASASGGSSDVAAAFVLQPVPLCAVTNGSSGSCDSPSSASSSSTAINRAVGSLSTRNGGRSVPVVPVGYFADSEDAAVQLDALRAGRAQAREAKRAARYGRKPAGGIGGVVGVGAPSSSTASGYAPQDVGWGADRGAWLKSHVGKHHEDKAAHGHPHHTAASAARARRERAAAHHAHTRHAHEPHHTHTGHALPSHSHDGAAHAHSAAGVGSGGNSKIPDAWTKYQGSGQVPGSPPAAQGDSAKGVALQRGDMSHAAGYTHAGQSFALPPGAPSGHGAAGAGGTGSTVNAWKTAASDGSLASGGAASSYTSRGQTFGQGSHWGGSAKAGDSFNAGGPAGGAGGDSTGKRTHGPHSHGDAIAQLQKKYAAGAGGPGGAGGGAAAGDKYSKPYMNGHMGGGSGGTHAHGGAAGDAGAVGATSTGGAGDYHKYDHYGAQYSKYSSKYTAGGAGGAAGGSKYGGKYVGGKKAYVSGGGKYAADGAHAGDAAAPFSPPFVPSVSSAHSAAADSAARAATGGVAGARGVGVGGTNSASGAAPWSSPAARAGVPSMNAHQWASSAGTSGGAGAGASVGDGKHPAHAHSGAHHGAGGGMHAVHAASAKHDGAVDASFRAHTTSSTAAAAHRRSAAHNHARGAPSAPPPFNYAPYEDAYSSMQKENPRWGAAGGYGAGSVHQDAHEKHTHLQSDINDGTNLDTDTHATLHRRIRGRSGTSEAAGDAASTGLVDYRAVTSAHGARVGAVGGRGRTASAAQHAAYAGDGPLPGQEGVVVADASLTHSRQRVELKAAEHRSATASGSGSGHGPAAEAADAAMDEAEQTQAAQAAQRKRVEQFKSRDHSEDFNLKSHVQRQQPASVRREYVREYAGQQNQQHQQQQQQQQYYQQLQQREQHQQAERQRHDREEGKEEGESWAHNYWGTYEHGEGLRQRVQRQQHQQHQQHQQTQQRPQHEQRAQRAQRAQKVQRMEVAHGRNAHFGAKLQSTYSALGGVGASGSDGSSGSGGVLGGLLGRSGSDGGASMMDDAAGGAVGGWTAKRSLTLAPSSNPRWAVAPDDGGYVAIVVFTTPSTDDAEEVANFVRSAAVVAAVGVSDEATRPLVGDHLV